MRVIRICCCVLFSLIAVTAVAAFEHEKTAGPDEAAALSGACSVAPLSEITDPEALRFEDSATPPDEHGEGLTRRTLAALARLKRFVISIGGVFNLRSGYRPNSYQAHLQEVWDKWIRDLRNNEMPECQNLRASVGQEFERHQLLEAQRPVTASDHTRGIAFDANVQLPPKARLHRRRVTVDLLARLSGLLRPDLFHDPVHFRLASNSGKIAVHRITARHARTRTVAHRVVRTRRTAAWRYRNA